MIIEAKENAKLLDFLGDLAMSKVSDVLAEQEKHEHGCIHLSEELCELRDGRRLLPSKKLEEFVIEVRKCGG